MSPLDFFQLLHVKYAEYGIVKVILPPNKRPHYHGLKDGVRFRAKILQLDLLDGNRREQRFVDLLSVFR